MQPYHIYIHSTETNPFSRIPLDTAAKASSAKRSEPLLSLRILTTILRTTMSRLGYRTSPSPASTSTPVYAGYHYARYLLQFMHYILASKEDLPSFPTEGWGQALVVPDGWKGDAAFSVSSSSSSGGRFGVDLALDLGLSRRGHG